MEMFGFICLTLLLVLFTCGWMFMFIFDGCFGGRRDIPVYVMVFILCAVIYGWAKLIEWLPFTVVMG